MQSTFHTVMALIILNLTLFARDLASKISDKMKPQSQGNDCQKSRPNDRSIIRSVTDACQAEIVGILGT
jgi:hypothetical protein